MKKNLILSIFTLSAIIFNSCSKDDNSDNDTQDYTITLESECGNQNSQTEYCVTEEEYRTTFDNTPVGDPCPFVTITDINGTNHSGILRNGGTGNCNNL